jgi:putative protease
LPRVLTVAEIARINKAVSVETEVFAFGGLCVMAEGRCLLSSYATGESPNMNGVCSPAEHVRYQETNGRLVSSLGGFAINSFAAGEPAGYPTLCKGRFRACGKDSYLFEEPTSLDAIRMLPALTKAGVTALKIEGRQRGKAYVAQVVSAFREAVDAVARGETPPGNDLAALTEGGRQTAGAYEKAWR